MSDPETGTTFCYRHPDREARLRCSRCERPICTDDMIDAPVGYQCPECARGGQPVRSVRQLLVPPLVTQTLVGTIAVIYLLSMAVPLTGDFALPPFLAGEQPWRLVTSAFLHAGLMHIGFNGLLLWQLGHMLEPVLGHLRFGALYLAGLAGGAFGIVGLAWLTVYTPLAEIPVLGFLFATHPGVPHLGASGAVFGLMGAAMAGMRSRGIDPWRSSIGGLVLLNLVITFVVPGISVGGHLGGFVGGLLAGQVLFVEPARAKAAAIRVLVAAVAVLAVTTLLF